MGAARPARCADGPRVALTIRAQRFFIRFRFAAIFREARTCFATYGTQAITAVQIIAMIAARAAARCRWRMRDTGSAARNRLERSAIKGGGEANRGSQLTPPRPALGPQARVRVSHSSWWKLSPTYA